VKRVCIYCGSSAGNSESYAKAVATLSERLVDQNLELVYGGGNIGLMGVAADAALARGGSVTGVIPEALMELEVGHTGLTTLHIVKDMHERKALMAQLSDAFVALPGGWGTLEELFEAMTWLQLGIHNKPCALFNIDGYYDALLEFLRNANTSGFVKTHHSDMLIHAKDPDTLIERISQFRASGSES